MHIYNRLVENSTIKNIGYLSIGSIVAQLIALIGGFYIPRLLGPQQFGVYQIVINYVSIFGVLTFEGVNRVALRESLRNLERTKEIIESITYLKNLCAIFAVALSITALFFVGYDNTTKLYIAFFSVTLLSNGWNNTLNIIYQTFENMKPLAILQTLKTTTSVFFSILFLQLGFGILSIISIQLFVSISILIINYIYSKKYMKLNLLSKNKADRLLIRQGFTFVLIRILVILSSRIDILMLSILTTSRNVGVYALAYNIVLSGEIIRGPISTSLFPYYTKKYKYSPVRINELIKHTAIIAIPSIIVAIGIIISSKFVVVTIVGKEFLESVKVLNVLIFYLVLSYSTIPWGLTLQTTNNEGCEVQIGFVRAALNVLLNILFYYRYGITGIAYSTLLAFMVANIYAVYLVKQKVINRVNDNNGKN